MSQNKDQALAMTAAQMLGVFMCAFAWVSFTLTSRYVCICVYVYACVCVVLFLCCGVEWGDSECRRQRLTNLTHSINVKTTLYTYQQRLTILIPPKKTGPPT